jgi:hypothetical protein
VLDDGTIEELHGLVPLLEQEDEVYLQRLSLSPEYRAEGEVARLLCDASSLGFERLRGLEVHCAIQGGSDDARRATRNPNCASAIVPARKTPITRDITGGI